MLAAALEYKVTSTPAVASARSRPSPAGRRRLAGGSSFGSAAAFMVVLLPPGGDRARNGRGRSPVLHAGLSAPVCGTFALLSRLPGGGFLIAGGAPCAG